MLIRDDLSRLLALDMDRVALVGSGIGPEPLGICRNPAVIPTPAAAFSYLQNVAMRQQISGKNVPLESLAWVGNSQVAVGARRHVAPARQGSRLSRHPRLHQQHRHGTRNNHAPIAGARQSADPGRVQ
jgi:hypothetical protein